MHGISGSTRIAGKLASATQVGPGGFIALAASHTAYRTTSLAQRGIVGFSLTGNDDNAKMPQDTLAVAIGWVLTSGTLARIIYHASFRGFRK